MSLTLEPLALGADPWTKIITTLAEKIASDDLSFVKLLKVLDGQSTLSVFTNIGVDSDKVWEPTSDQCPAITLIAQPHPGVDDHGAGMEVWYLDVAVDMKLLLAEGNADYGYHAAYELIRTIFCGWRQGLATDPISALPEVADYGIDGEVVPRVVTAAVGRYVARCYFILRFRLADRILG